MKRLTGGDTLVGAKLYGQHFHFEPSHKLWFQANHLPMFKDPTHGLVNA
jgi:phage/plasmid-associated DNA primase